MRILLLLFFLFICAPHPVLAQESAGASGLGWRQGGVASSTAPFLVTSLTDGLNSERLLTSGTPHLSFTDGGPNGNYTLNIAADLSVTDGGTGASTAAAALINLIGTPTKGKLLVGNGTAWTLLDAPVSNDLELLSDDNETTGVKWGSLEAVGPTNVEYLVLTLDAGLSGERRLVGTTNKITLTDLGANDDLVINIGTDVVTLTGTQSLSNKTLTNPILNDQITVEKGATDVLLTFAAPASSTRTINFPDPGANVDVVYTNSAQTIAGVKTFSSAPVLSTNTLSGNGNTMTFPSSAQTLVGLTDTVTLTNKTATSLIAQTSLVLKQTTANYTLTWADPTGARAIRIQDVGASSDIMLKDQGDSYTAGGVPFGDGSLMQISGGGSQGQVFTMGASNIPSWQDAPARTGFGGDASDGDLTVSSNTVLEDYRIENYNNVTITDTVDGLFIYEYTKVVNVAGDLTIDGNITVNRTTDDGGSILPFGSSAKLQGGDGGGTNGGKGAHAFFRAGGAGGASAVAAGGSGGAAAASNDYAHGPQPHWKLWDRSGAGGTGSSNGTSIVTEKPGVGGGGLPALLFLTVGDIDIQDDAVIVARGGNATAPDSGAPAGGGGGGGGGSIGFFSQSTIVVNASAQLDVGGGNGSSGGSSGNNGGGGGGGGGLLLFYSTTAATVSATPDVSGGSAGSANGSGENGVAGADGLVVVVEGTPNLPIMSYFKENGFQNLVPLIAAAKRNGNVVELNHHDICRTIAKGDAVKYFQLVSERQTRVETTCAGIGDAVKTLENAA